MAEVLVAVLPCLLQIGRVEVQIIDVSASKASTFFVETC